MSFPNVPNIKDYKIVFSNERNGEMFDGAVMFDRKVRYFKFSHEFDEGNTYIVYDENFLPIAYFSVNVDF